MKVSALLWRVAVVVALASAVTHVVATKPGREEGPSAAAPAPMLGVTFAVSGTLALYGVRLIAAYGIGHCSISVVAGEPTSRVGRYLRWTDASRGAVYLRYVSGLLVLAGGVYLVCTA